MTTNNDAVTVSFRAPRPVLEKFLQEAEAVGSVDRQGRNAGRGSVGAVVFDVAVGRLKLTMSGGKEPVPAKKEETKERKPFNFWPKSPPQWWRKDYEIGGMIDLETLTKKTGYTRRVDCERVEMHRNPCSCPVAVLGSEGSRLVGGSR